MALTLTQSLSDPASWQEVVKYSGSNTMSITATILANTTDQLVNASIPISPAPVFLSMLATGANLTVKTNSSSSPANTFNLIAGNPLLWDGNAAYFSDPITTGVTALYVTNSSGSAATLQINVIWT
jgi:hypothetical protein